MVPGHRRSALDSPHRYFVARARAQQSPVFVHTPGCCRGWNKTPATTTGSTNKNRTGRGWPAAGGRVAVVAGWPVRLRGYSQPGRAGQRPGWSVGTSPDLAALPAVRCCIRTRQAPAKGLRRQGLARQGFCMGRAWWYPRLGRPWSHQWAVRQHHSKPPRLQGDGSVSGRGMVRPRCGSLLQFAVAGPHSRVWH